jgi:cadherin 5 type 2 (VE-cadherin)
LNLDCSGTQLFAKFSGCVLFVDICLADPLPPAWFEVDREKSTSTSLLVWWTPSLGKVSLYKVKLFDESNQKIQEVQVQENTSRNEYTFSNLTAGHNYNFSITAVSGDKHSSTVFTNGSTGKTCTTHTSSL